MGLTYSTTPPLPPPISVSLVHLHPQHRSIDGYVEDNQYTLEYTLQRESNSVALLLSMTQQHGTPSGNGILGFTREKYDWNSRTSQPAMLPLDEQIHDEERLYLVVLWSVIDYWLISKSF